MSWKATAYVKGLRENLTRSEKLVLMMLADYHNDETGQCDPSLQRLADDCLSSRRNVIRLLQALDGKGFLTTIERSNQTNQYNLNLGSDTMSLVTNKSQNVTRVVTKSTFRGDIAMSPKPKGTVIEPKKPRAPLPKKVKTLTEDDIQKCVAKYSDVWTELEVRERIESALNHTASLKAINLPVYVNRWLARDANNLSGYRNGSNNYPPEVTYSPGGGHLERPTTKRY